jgi:hypothetical protein
MRRIAGRRSNPLSLHTCYDRFIKTPTGLVRRRNGRWLARITWTNRANGKRTERSAIVSSASEGHDRITEWRRELRETGDISSDGPSANEHARTFADLADFYETRYVVSPTYQNNRKLSGMRVLGHKVAQTTRRYINLHEQAALQIAALLDRRAKGIRPLDSLQLLTLPSGRLNS